VLQTHLFDAFVTPRDPVAGGGFVRFGVPDALRAVLAQSGRWGRIKAEAVCAMTSKYAMALYELIGFFCSKVRKTTRAGLAAQA
jgi:hypothetical protein